MSDVSYLFTLTHVSNDLLEIPSRGSLYFSDNIHIYSFVCLVTICESQRNLAHH